MSNLSIALREALGGDLGPRIQVPQAGAPAQKGMSKGQMILGILGDALGGAVGRAPAFGQMIQQQRQDERQQAQQAAQWGLRRQGEREDKQWEWANKPREAPAPTEFERMLEASGIQRGTPQWTAAMGRAVETRLNPMTPMPTFDASGNPAVTYVPRNAPGGPPTASPGAVSGPPEGAVNLLRQNPALKADFDAKYGPGSADRYLGGGVSNGTGGFP